VSRYYGTRHRAAIGLTRETDAIVVVCPRKRAWFRWWGRPHQSGFFPTDLRDRLRGLLHTTTPKAVEG
jgi:hypothetical protein